MSPVPPFCADCCGGGGGVAAIFDVFANRPAANAVDAGTIFVATDTGDEYISDGTSWYLLGSAAAGTVWTSPQIDVAAGPYAAANLNALYTLSVQVAPFTLPVGTADTNLVVIKDYTGNATAQPHSIEAAAGDTIEHIAAYPLNGDNDSVVLSYNPVDSNWMVI